MRDRYPSARDLDVVIGRQPIFDRSRTIVGYELLFRHIEPGTELAKELSGDLMTAEVLFSSVAIGIDRLVGDQRAFVNADRGLLVGEVAPVLPPERVVFEVLETIDPDKAVLEGCAKLVAQGYELALDDFTWFDGAEDLLELASIVKIDLLRLSHAELPGLMERCRAFDTLLVAEKVETPDQLLSCLELGFDYFQGYVLSRPETVSGRGLNPANLPRLQLVAKLLDASCDVAEIEGIVATDPAMAHQLLELAGIGAASGTRRKVRTLREAVVLAGVARMRSWASLLLLIERGSGSEEQMTTALVRARMCELLVALRDRSAAPFAFTAGMVSAFDLLLGARLEEILASLPIAHDLRNAAVGDLSPVGRVVSDVIDYQLGVRPIAPRSGFDDWVVHAAWTQAMSWAVATSSAARPAA